MQSMSLFPEWENDHPAPFKKPRPPWKPNKVQQLILAELRKSPQDEKSLFQIVVGFAKEGQLGRAVDEPVRQGLITDSGERGVWTRQGRMIVWRIADRASR